MLKWISLFLLASTVTAARADITPEDGQKFEPYAVTAGLMDTMGDACLEKHSAVQAAGLAASMKLQATLTKYGMPTDAFAADYKKGEEQGRNALTGRGSKAQLCTDKVLGALNNWPSAVDTVVDHLNQVAAQ